MITRWKIWYDNGYVATSDKYTPDNVPLDGVLAIGEVQEDGRKQTYWGADYYFWTGDGWAAGNLADLERWLRKAMPQLKYGRWTGRDEWLAIRGRVRREWLDQAV